MQLIRATAVLLSLVTLAAPDRGQGDRGSGQPAAHSPEAAPLHSNSKGTIALENSTLKALFDAHTGALLSLESKLTRWHVQNRPQLGRSFEMIVPLPDRRDNPVRGEKTPLASSEVSPNGESVIFVWNNLVSEYGGKLDVSFKSTVTLNADGLAFHPEIVNHSPYTVETISYPILGDVPVPPGETTLRRANWDYGHLRRTRLLPEFENQKGYFGVDYPIQMVPSTNNQLFILLEAEKQGLYAVVQDPSMKELVEWTFELRPGYQGSLIESVPPGNEISGHPVHLVFSAIHYPFAASGESAVLSPIVLEPYSGTWHSGVDLYKHWRATWFQEP